jgi:hypothetical protein
MYKIKQKPRRNRGYAFINQSLKERKKNSEWHNDFCWRCHHSYRSHYQQELDNGRCTLQKVQSSLTILVSIRTRTESRMEAQIILVGFEVLTAVSTKMAVFGVVAPCSLVEVYQRFRGPCCLHHQGDEWRHGATTQKTTIFASNLCF